MHRTGALQAAAPSTIPIRADANVGFHEQGGPVVNVPKLAAFDAVDGATQRHRSAIVGCVEARATLEDLKELARA